MYLYTLKISSCSCIFNLFRGLPNEPKSQPLLSWMLSVQMESLGGHGVWRRIDGGAVCMQPAPCEVDQAKVISILFEAKRRRKDEEKSCTGYCIIYSRSFLE